MTAEVEFLSKFKGYFSNILRWPELDTLWQTLRDGPMSEWYVYAVGEAPPESVATPAEMERFLAEIDLLLRREHDEDYCGIVYVDDRAAPSFIKIYDPNNLGSVCGSGSLPPPHPGWILSKLRPVDLDVVMPLANNRRRWWQKIFA